MLNRLSTRHVWYLVGVAAILIALGALSGCSAIGIQADTFNKRVVVANHTIATAASTVETLEAAGKLSKPDARAVLARVAQVALAVDVAVEVHKGDAALGTSKLDAALVVLTAINRELEARK